jgi:L-asparaginase/Glu-tRNA(Gln) amidotransferase subunit D
MPLEQVDAVLDLDRLGFVVRTFGGGSVQPEVRKRLAARSQTAQIVLTAGSLGPVSNDELYATALDDMREAGIAIENWLSARQARVRLALFLAAGRSYEPFGTRALERFAGNS